MAPIGPAVWQVRFRPPYGSATWHSPPTWKSACGWVAAWSQKLALAPAAGDAVAPGTLFGQVSASVSSPGAGTQITAGRRLGIDRSGHGHTDGHGRHRLGSVLDGDVPDPRNGPPAVAATGTTPACCARAGSEARCVRRRAAAEARSETTGDQQMPATLKVTHKAIGAEVRRGTYDVVVDGERAGSVDMNHTIEIPVEPGRHTLQFATDETRAALRPSTPPRTESPCEHREEILADLSRILCGTQAGTETRSQVSRRLRRGAHQHIRDTTTLTARSQPGSNIVEEHGRASAQDAQIVRPSTALSGPFGPACRQMT